MWKLLIRRSIDQTCCYLLIPDSRGEDLQMNYSVPQPPPFHPIKHRNLHTPISTPAERLWSFSSDYKKNYILLLEMPGYIFLFPYHLHQPNLTVGVPRMEPRTLHRLGKYSRSQLHPWLLKMSEMALMAYLEDLCSGPDFIS